MSKAHFHDLTTIVAPFDLLDDDTKTRLHDAAKRGADFDLVTDALGGWCPIQEPKMMGCYTYRVNPNWKPIPPSVPWHLFKPEWRFHARDQNGEAFLFMEKPERREYTWASSGVYARVDLLKDYDPGTVSWENSLLERPQGV